MVRDQEVGGSNPLAPTTSSIPFPAFVRLGTPANFCVGVEGFPAHNSTEDHPCSPCFITARLTAGSNEGQMDRGLTREIALPQERA